MSKKHGKLEEIKSALITVAVVVVLMQIVVLAVRPYLPIIFMGIVLITAGAFLYNKTKHL
jgi:uncharacterized membrane protein YvlD (DUF360 family)